MSTRPESRWPPVSYWMKATVGVLAVLALARIALAIGDILVLVLVSLILALGFQPALAWLERRGLSRGLSVALGLLAGMLVIGAFLALVLPGIVRQVSELVEAVPGYISQAEEGSGFLGDLNERFDLQAKVEDAQEQLPQTALGLIGSFTSFVFGSLTVFVLTLYFTINLPRMRETVATFLGRRDRQDFHEIYDETIRRVGGYVLGNLAVSAVAGTVSFIALLLIGVPFAAALAFLVALMDLIPTIGAVIGAAVAVAVAAFVGIPQMIATAVFFLVYQQIENYVIQPRVMGRTIQMSAPLIILAVLIGGTLLGVIGALLAIPMAAIIKVVLHELYLEERIEEIEKESVRARRQRA